MTFKEKVALSMFIWLVVFLPYISDTKGYIIWLIFVCIAQTVFTFTPEKKKE
jgi:hypothetical protein